MSIRLEMLQVARLAPKILGDATELVVKFLHSQQNPDGGFRDRKGQSDLYYTVFGLDALTALQQPFDAERVRGYATSFGDGATLDFVHLCALARCWAAIEHSSGEISGRAGFPQSAGRRGAGTAPYRNEFCDGIIERLATFRARDGGFNPKAGSARGTAYGAFLAVAAHQDLRVTLPEPMELVRSLKFLETQDGGWTNEVFGRGPMPVGATNATAAAVTVLRNLNMPVNSAVGAWLLAQVHPQGGFLAVPGAPIPDLLSTATALHALAGLQISFEKIKEPCLDFVDSLWTNDGGFHGNWADDHLDCEYTCYGLLALGHLSL
ncbi:MAG TPA: prenyltransferase/squalene oxidase repeat-containing protein [Methylomirabilota bacterium]|nr:prenyltransferase/squalene oxidase repeat-containing protein [Methylomirabilota bacterium]